MKNLWIASALAVACVASMAKIPAPVLDDARVHVVNLSRGDMIEVLLVNTSGENVQAHIVRNAPADLTWTTGERPEKENPGALPPVIPVGGWLWGRSGHREGAV